MVTCEHGGNLVPREHARLLAGCGRMLASHRGWDPGALELAGAVAIRLRAPLRFALVTRLLVDLNRSIDHPQVMAGPATLLTIRQRRAVLDRHYHPYRREVERLARRLGRAGPVLHLSVHTFTPVLGGQRRRTGIGLLFDPARAREVRFVDALERELRRRLPRVRIDRNKPYRGTDDGLTTHLRARLDPHRYLGIELEVNQRYPRAATPRGRAAWKRLQSVIAESIAAAAGSVAVD